MQSMSIKRFANLTSEQPEEMKIVSVLGVLSQTFVPLNELPAFTFKKKKTDRMYPIRHKFGALNQLVNHVHNCGQLNN